MNAETLGALISFLHQNSSDILSFAAPFPELRAWIEWIINFLDEEKKRPSGKGTERGGST
jgi:hypothetical protein